MSRYVTVASVSHDPACGADRVRVLEQAGYHAERAAHQGADIVAFPECYPQVGHPRGWDGMIELAEGLDGPTITAMAGRAKQLGMHIVWPTLTREGEVLRNSSVLLDPRGEIRGVYHKRHPTIGEIENGVLPGTDAGVFDTDLGRVGLCICFDLNFEDTMTGLGAAGEEVVFFSSMYRGGLQVRMWAYLLGTYMVSAITGELGVIVDQGGEVLAESTSDITIVRRVNLDSRLMHLDENQEKLDAMLGKYGPDISFRYHSREGCFTLASERDGLSVDDLMGEFGLESRADYFARSNRRREEALIASEQGRQA